MKTLITLGVASTLLLTGCAATANDTSTDGPVVAYDEHNPDDWYIQQIRMDDGRKVDCIVYYQYTSGGPAISCDWDGAVDAFGEVQE